MPKAKAPASKSNGVLIAATLGSSWRKSPAPANISEEELSRIAPLLLGSGAGSLGWRRVRRSNLSDTEAAAELLQAYRLHTLQAEVHRLEIKHALRLLREAGIEPVLIKGWAVARLYAERGLRPYGDKDMIVRPEQREKACEILKAGRLSFHVDVEHDEFEGLDGRSLEELYRRTQLIGLDETFVRVLGAEDELKLLCVHLLRHGAWRPLWLCDVAAAIEAASPAFDWDYCLKGKGPQVNWITCALGLAETLLGADLSAFPLAEKAGRIPVWLVRNVLKQWETPYPWKQAPMRYGAPAASYLRHPSGVLKDLANRWPNPIEATVQMEGEFNGLPRLPFQLGNCFSRTTKFMAHLPRLLREQYG
jgi:Uncharacterised nucleotidyltransferase